MNNTYYKKLRHIFPVLAAITFGTVITVVALRWLLDIQFQVLELKEEVWNIWIPLVLPWIPITLWLRQRLRVLTFKSEEDRRRLLFQFITWGTMAAMLFISQAYLTTATGKLTELKQAEDIHASEPTRYYRMERFFVNTAMQGATADFSTSGKYNDKLNIDIYFVSPMLNDSAEQFSASRVWYGVKFHKQISNRLSPQEKENEYQAFSKQCEWEMKGYDYTAFDHLERTPLSDDRDHFLEAIETRYSPTDDSYIVLKPVKEKFESRNGSKLVWIFGSFGIGMIIFMLTLLWPGFSEEAHKRFFEGRKEEDDIIDMLKYLIPKDEHFVTSVIIDLNLLVFIVMIFSGVHIISPNGLELLEWGANRRAETTGGELWRLFTSMFLHGGIMHLMLNIFGLVIAAIFVEPLLGRKKYAILYIVSGLCGSIASIWWYPNTISVGASGAIFGLYGAILGLLLTDAFPKESRKGMLIMMGVYVGINLLFGLMGGIDNAAHIGGLVSGAVVGIVLYKIKK